MKIKSGDFKAPSFPDVCVTPSPGGPVPIPYPNVQMADKTGVSKTHVQTKGVSGAGAEAIVKGMLPDSANDRLRFTNAATSVSAAVKPAMSLMGKSGLRPPRPRF